MKTTCKKKDFQNWIAVILKDGIERTIRFIRRKMCFMRLATFPNLLYDSSIFL